jgi:uncharacterized protein YukE
MSLFVYTAQEVLDSIALVARQIQTAEEVSNRLRVALAPIENGAWEGEGSAAFIEDMRILIGQTDAEAAALQEFFGDLSQCYSEMETLESSLMATIAS